MAEIWVVEDDRSIQLLVSAALGKVGHRARCLGSGTALEAALGEGRPDLLILDVMLPGQSGFALLKAWKERSATAAIPVLMLSARTAEEDKVRGLMLGAEDYIPKPFGVRELQARVAAALRRVQGAEVLRLGGLTVHARQREVAVDGRRVQLTGREHQLLLYLARRPGETVSRETLLREVWGSQFDQDPTRTVDYHIKALRQKLGEDARRPRYLRTVHGVGYRLMAPEEGEA